MENKKDIYALVLERKHMEDPIVYQKWSLYNKFISTIFNELDKEDRDYHLMVSSKKYALKIKKEIYEYIDSSK